ncbi:TolC family outer membrane protein [uncultured Litoreibacter sp.]|uniref:TolC family outer membrane protein n=1 Tax=uncultured Litoreibacter sp. TaxID=1392394 RepID=UPI0026307171|nr:TolC family outer membrane protein [uncultured Litoreibacter sp.]
MKTKVWRKVVGAAATVATLAITPTAASSETLQDALVAAYLNSNLLEQNRALLRATDEDVAVALSALRPQISAISTFGHADQATGPAGGNLSATVSVGLDLLLYDAGRTKLGVEAAKETVLATRAQLVNAEQQVLLNAVNAYVGVLRDARVVSLRQNNLRLITQELRAARDRFDVGEVTRTDVAQAEARLAEARGALAQAQGNLAISQELYVATVGKRPGNLSAIPSLPPLPGSVADARALGERNSPSIDQAQHEIRANELNAARARAAIRPTIGLTANAGHSRRNDNNSSIGLQMTVPIYQGGQLKALERKALAQVHASRSNLNQAVLIVRQNVSDSWSTLAVANAQLQASERQIRAAQVAFNGVREEAKLGARTTLDVLDAEQSLFDARTNRVVFETQVYAAAYQLLSSMGLLTVSDLKLPVKQYDPNEYFDAVKGAPVRRTKQGDKLDRILGRYQK